MAEIVTMPKLGFDMAEGTLVRWVKNEGDKIEKGEVLAEIETDKATVEVESNFAGVVRKYLVAIDEVVPVNSPIAVIGSADETIDLEKLGLVLPSATPDKKVIPETAQPQEDVAQSTPVQAQGENLSGFPGGVKASPLARRLAEEHGYDLKKIKGTGPGGRIIKTDVESYRPEASISPAPTEAPVAGWLPPLEEKRIPLNRLRAAIGRRMVAAKQQVPHFYVTHQYDMQPLLNTRKQINLMLPDDEKLSVNDFIIKAVALALRQHPGLNASLEENTVVQHGSVNIGVAVAVEGGLLTVVCRHADQKPLRMIASEVRAMVQRAREGKVKPDDIEGSTFSISNLGMFDVENFLAIINPPEAAILAVGSAQEISVVKDGQIIPGLRMKATISVDHRVSDGAEAARFMQTLAEYLEKPIGMLI